MKKLRKIIRIRDDAWVWMSKYTRLKYADEFGMTYCYTCNKKHHWKELHGGHYIHGHNKFTFLVEMNVKPQCVSCNKYLSGNLGIYGERLIKEFGMEKVDELRRLSYEVVKLDRTYYEAMLEKYKVLYTEECKKRNMEV